MDIRPIADHEEYRAVERLQTEVWNLPEVEIVPVHVLVTAARNGGLLLGAFDGRRLAGFVFGFPGLTAAGALKHCSHMAGVHPAYRDQNLGHQLKLAQREHVLAQGLDLITWTFDPLEARNAWLNFHKLGVVSSTYLRNIYGDMRDGLNAGLPSDRLQVEWWIRSERVERLLHANEAPPSASSSLGERAGVRDERTLIEIPANFQTLKTAGIAQALQWRMNTRRAFEDAFAQGYRATDFMQQGNARWYLLQSHPTEDTAAAPPSQPPPSPQPT